MVDPGKPRRLLLFDIDGTLLSVDGVARRPFRTALRAVYGTAGPIDRHSFAGKTDPQIVRELLAAAGVEPQRIDAGLPSLWSLYLEELEPALRRQRPVPCPGVDPLLDRLQGPDADGELVVGLLTGNIRGGARLKLEAGGVGFDRFRLGAFGSDSADRRRLPEVAVDRAERLTGHRFDGEEIVIVGDTPADIDCGRHLGVTTVAVATGTYGIEDLRAAKPDYLFPTLERTDEVWKSLSP